MKKALLTAITISALLISSMVTACPHPVRADSTDFISFLDSGVTIFSPVNMTYNYRNLTLNLTLTVGYIHGEAGIIVTEVPSMNYSIDGVYNGSVLLWVATTQTHMTIQGVGSVVLPELPDGSHYLTIHLYGYNMQSFQPQFKSYVDTVYFSIDDPNSIFIPTPSPTQTPTVVPTLTPSPSPSLTPTPSPSPSLSLSSAPTPSTRSSSSPTPIQEKPYFTSPSQQPSFLGTNLPIEYGYGIIAVLVIILFIGIISLVFFKKLRKQIQRR
jgi:hypothetical protein